MPRLLPRLLLAYIFSILVIIAQEAEPTSPGSDQAEASPAALAQEGGSQPVVPITADPEIKEEVLRLMVAPLTHDELTVEVEAWQALLKQKALEIAAQEIRQLNRVNTPENEMELIQMRQQKSELATRYTIVLDSFGKKGGEIEPYQQYLAVVSDIKPGAINLRSRFKALTLWFSAKNGGKKVLVQALQFIGIMVVFWVIAIFISKLVHRVIDRQPHLSSLLKVFINKICRRVILLVGLVVALGTVGVNVGAALALIGGGAFIAAFALQDTLSNFAAGIMLLFYRPFDVGDAVEVGGIAGSVDNVSLVSTTIRTFDNKKVLVPNKKVWGETITNITGMPTRRVDMVFGISYDDDVDQAQEILERIVEEHELTLEIPEPAIHLNELADFSVNFICRPWAKTADHWTVYWDITKRVKKEFDAAGITIPYPQRDVNVRTLKEELENK